MPPPYSQSAVCPRYPLGVLILPPNHQTFLLPTAQPPTTNLPPIALLLAYLLASLLLQVQELLSDLQQAFASGQEHFLGAIVTTRRGEAAGEPYWVRVCPTCMCAQLPAGRNPAHTHMCMFISSCCA